MINIQTNQNVAVKISQSVIFNGMKWNVSNVISTKYIFTTNWLRFALHKLRHSHDKVTMMIKKTYSTSNRIASDRPYQMLTSRFSHCNANTVEILPYHLNCTISSDWNQVCSSAMNRTPCMYFNGKESCFQFRARVRLRMI